MEVFPSIFDAAESLIIIGRWVDGLVTRNNELRVITKYRIC